MINAAMLFMQNIFPHREKITNADFALLGLNAIFLSAGILANLGFEEIGLDLYVVTLLALISTYLLLKARQTTHVCLLYQSRTGWD